MERLAITVEGIVQGVGFRPFVYREAISRGISGWVCNGPGGVLIEAQGPDSALDDFVRALRVSAPPQADVYSLEVSSIDIGHETDFSIKLSEPGDDPRPTIPADLAVCHECLAEIADPAARRYRYPFTNCTNCGPRYSIIASLPYDRPRTVMSKFALCPSCSREYGDVADRRFHAQPVACPECGPALRLVDGEGRLIASRDDALQAAARAIVDGQIVAVKGLGGFQLVVDATSGAAVARLRARKNREAKPFALMFPTLEAVRSSCLLSDDEEALLCSPRAPIVLLRRCEADVSGICDEVAPGNPLLGAMLPYTPLHHLLTEAVARPIVCTSGNVADEPMCIDDQECLSRLGDVADGFLLHDRSIVRPVDDSIARVGPDGPRLLRRARGFAPLPLVLDEDVQGVFAVGGHLKSTIAVGMGNQAVMSQHLGDLDGVEAVRLLERTVEDLQRFFAITPSAVACDLHPDYASTRLAERLASRWGVPLERVQHHHAHVAACAAEHGFSGEYFGLAWDGTGLGTDGTVWGGEGLLCDGAGFERRIYLRPFALPGAEAAIREPRRAALGLLHAYDAESAHRFAPRWFSREEARALMSVLDRRGQAPLTSSIGRLFDAVAALVGIRGVNRYEGEAAMELEHAASRVSSDEAYDLPIEDVDGAGVVNWAPLVAAVKRDLDRSIEVDVISARFHNALANMALAAARQVGVKTVVLSGGCFQNDRLLRSVVQRLLAGGFEVLWPRVVPPNDGGLSLGQLLVAARRRRK